MGGSEKVKTFERIIVKIIVIQFLFLIGAQFFFHQLSIFPELKIITKYEGVNKSNFTDFLETFNGK